ncbi:hypothetical protein Sango_2742200 [Sesamum angolense]|uniref:Uncharacterized protein n=1 Tax=Sesamum angolense TaxID=2727404 RepID=A0AAE1T930_9LAMI|nr:hypothetical protein Sango_2742200 [Sesamum angolense]
MVYTYTPTYYTSLHDSITSICKNILPFSFKKRRLPAIAAAEQRAAKQQSDNLKWQQESYHQILNLMGLCKEGILHENEVSAFRTHLLETLTASPFDHDYEPSVIIRDKLIFLQELLYAKCISEDEYHASKRPLLQRLALQGAEIGARDVIVGAQKETSNEKLSVIDVKEDKLMYGSTPKKIKGTASLSGFVSPDKNGILDDKGASDSSKNSIKPRDLNASTVSLPRNQLVCSTENPFWNCHLSEKENESKSILMMESVVEAPVLPEKQSGSEKGKKKPFRALFQRDQKEGHGIRVNEHGQLLRTKENVKSVKRTWAFDGFRKWKKNDPEDETTPLSVIEKSDDASYTGEIVQHPVGKGSETKQMRKKLHANCSPAEFFIDEVSGESIKNELSRIQNELHTRSPHIHLSDDRTEEISTRLPADNNDLKEFFPKSWCDRHGDAVLDTVRKEFKDHVEEMGSSRVTASEKNNSKRWTTFDDEENSHPNLFAFQDHSYSMKQARLSSSRNARTSYNSSSIDKGFRYNPFFDM